VGGRGEVTIQLSDVTLYYEVVGHGAPCVLVHGAWENHRIFLKTADRLKERFTCYLVDSRGHGRSSPVKEFHYREMADDMVRFLDVLNLSNVMFVGFSDGGIIGLLAASKSGRIDRLVACSANTIPEGLHQAWLCLLKVIHFFSRNGVSRMLIEEPDISDAELQNIRAKSLIIAGSRDLILRNETDHIAAKIPDAEEMILPGHTHRSYLKKNDLLGNIILNWVKD
jgi:pimeloyl-ACP methyl ester carboxylesterase